MYIDLLEDKETVMRQRGSIVELDVPLVLSPNTNSDAKTTTCWTSQKMVQFSRDEALILTAIVTQALIYVVSEMRRSKGAFVIGIFTVVLVTCFVGVLQVAQFVCYTIDFIGTSTDCGGKYVGAIL